MNAKSSSDNQPGTQIGEDQPKSELRQKAETLLAEVSGFAGSISQVDISLTLTPSDLREIRELASDGLKKLETTSSMDDYTLQMLGHTGAEIDSIRERYSSGISVLEKLDRILDRQHAPTQEKLEAIADAARKASETIEDQGILCEERLPSQEDANAQGMVEWLRSGVWMHGAFDELPVDATRWRKIQ
ncbi:hypothetical protein [Marinobacter sp.]|uniref:hypothetical protein n=1 Tax=Marinobacter sp. TaxID=50741 RepID=UPI0035624CF1